VYIFYCTSGKFREVMGVFLTEKHSPDAVLRGTERWTLASGVLSVPGSAKVKHRTHYTGRRVFPVHASCVA